MTIAQKANTVFKTLCQRQDAQGIAPLSYAEGRTLLSFGKNDMYNALSYLKKNKCIAPIARGSHTPRWQILKQPLSTGNRVRPVHGATQRRAFTILETLKASNTKEVVFSYQDGYQRFGYSRSMVRDAFRYLKDNGYVERTSPVYAHRRGMWRILKTAPQKVLDLPIISVSKPAQTIPAQIFSELLKIRDGKNQCMFVTNDFAAYCGLSLSQLYCGMTVLKKRGYIKKVLAGRNKAIWQMLRVSMRPAKRRGRQSRKPTFDSKPIQFFPAAQAAVKYANKAPTVVINLTLEDPNYCNGCKFQKTVQFACPIAETTIKPSTSGLVPRPTTCRQLSE